MSLKSYARIMKHDVVILQYSPVPMTKYLEARVEYPLNARSTMRHDDYTSHYKNQLYINALETRQKPSAPNPNPKRLAVTLNPKPSTLSPIPQTHPKP